MVANVDDRDPNEQVMLQFLYHAPVEDAYELRLETALTMLAATDVVAS